MTLYAKASPVSNERVFIDVEDAALKMCPEASVVMTRV